MVNPFFYNIAEICSRSGLQDIILSPGSRCAPLTIAFNRHSGIKIKVISDERSAAYIGLGFALANKTPTGLVCTSGTAAANYLPAITEAFYQNIPLVVFTADRPPEWIDQQDGQAIRQNNLYGNHVKGSYSLPLELDHPDVCWHFTRVIMEAIHLANSFPQGPVHINIPIREPFYPKKDEEISFSNQLKIRENAQLEEIVKLDIQTKEYLNEVRKIVIVGGQHRFDETITSTLSSLSDKHIPVIGDIISNLHGVSNIIAHPDNFLSNLESNEELLPDLLITFGKSVISKNLKLFFRKNRVKNHWHIQESGDVADPFQSITKVIYNTPEKFLQVFDEHVHSKDNLYQNLWLEMERKCIKANDNFFNNTDSGEFALVHHFMRSLPLQCNLHLSNSMAVRYANFSGIQKIKKIEVFSNRGTSGIDGSNSTAVGVAMADPGKQNFLLTGDMAFLYDRNAYWHNYPLDNLKVLVLNNHGGGIFRMIDGPGQLPELEELFETKQKSSAKYLANEYDIKYFHSMHNSNRDLLQDFFDYKGAAIFEFESAGLRNHEIFKEYKNQMNKAVKKL